LRARPRAFRMQTRGVEGIETKMIGRDGELKLLQDALMLCMEDGETQMVTVTAEAGVGKSRLLFEFSRWIDVIDQIVLFFEGRATPQTTNLPYSLIRSVFSFRFEILDSDAPEVMRDKFTQGIAQFMGENTADEAAFIGQLVGFDFSEHPAVSPVLKSAEVFQRQALEHLQTFFRSITATGPAIIELEDIHWADTYSLDLINRLVADNRTLPLMVICMARPELHQHRPGWGEGQDFHHHIDLKPLSKLDTRRLVREVLQRVDDIPAEIRDLIVERADGNPFYIEELVKILLEDGVIVKGETDDANWRVLPERLADLRVPPTLTGVLQARLDTLEPMARLLLGRASVIGRIFWVSAVQALESADSFHIEQIERVLQELRRRELIYLREKSDFAGTQEYVIKHAILRDVIYESLLKRQQRAYHGAVAQWLIEASAERADEYTALIAEHYEKAAETLKAAQYLLTAAQQAYRISAYPQARALLQDAVKLLPTEDQADVRLVRVNINALLGEVYDLIGEYQLARPILESALADARMLGNKEQIVWTLGLLGRIVGLRQGEWQAGDAHFSEAHALLQDMNNPNLMQFILRQVANLYQDIEEKRPLALTTAEESVTIARQVGNLFEVVSSLNTLGNVLTTLQRDDEAIVAYEEAIRIGQEIGDTRIVAYGTNNLGNCYIAKKDYPKALAAFEMSLHMSQKLGMSEVVPRSNIANVGVSLGHTVDVIETNLQIVLRTALQNNALPFIVGMIEIYGLLYEREGQYQPALHHFGLLLASPFVDPISYEAYDKPALERMRQKLSDAVVDAGLAHGATLDAITVGRSLLKNG
jgi:tetratricopeptide (TPR) repeat protein